MSAVRAVTLRQPHATLVAHGVQPWVTMPSRGKVQVGDGVLVTAGGGPVRTGRIGSYVVDGRRRRDVDVPHRLWRWENERLAEDYLVPLGPCVPARGRVGDVVPVVGWADLGDPECIVVHDDALHHCIPSDESNGPQHITGSLVPDGAHLIRDISDQLPFCDWSLGWAFRLVDVEPLDEPVREYRPWGRQVEGDLLGALEASLLKAEAARKPPIPVRGRAGWWTPDPGLVEACR